MIDWTERLIFFGIMLFLVVLLFFAAKVSFEQHEKEDACKVSCLPDALLRTKYNSDSTYCFCSQKTITLNKENKPVLVQRYEKELK